jgi:hypothetical protein
MAEVDDREKLRARLKDLLRSVPDKVNGGGIQTVRNFKKFHADATKILNSDRASLAQLIGAINTASSYHS